MSDEELPRPPLSFFMAAGWTLLALALIQLVAALALKASPGARLDLTGLVACQSIAFLLTIYAITRLHAADRSLSDALGLRPTSPLVCVVAAGLGAVLLVPATALDQVIERRFPLTEAEVAARAEMLVTPSLRHAIALVVAAAVVGPLVEELFFRGALFGGLRKTNAAATTTFGVALFFAAAHQDARAFIPTFLVGLAITHARSLSGSLWPGLTLHFAFNATSILPSLVAGTGLDAPDPPVPPAIAVAGAAVSLALVAALRVVAARSPACERAREADLG